MKKTVWKRSLSLLLCLVLALSLLPAALAAETEEPAEVLALEEPTEEPVGDDAPGVPEAPAEAPAAPIPAEDLPGEVPGAEPIQAVQAEDSPKADGVAIDETNFPDANFRDWVSRNADTDGNSVLSTTEAAAVKGIYVAEKESLI